MWSGIVVYGHLLYPTKHHRNLGLILCETVTRTYFLIDFIKKLDLEICSVSNRTKQNVQAR